MHKRNEGRLTDGVADKICNGLGSEYIESLCILDSIALVLPGSTRYSSGQVRHAQALASLSRRLLSRSFGTQSPGPTICPSGALRRELPWPPLGLARGTCPDKGKR